MDGRKEEAPMVRLICLAVLLVLLTFSVSEAIPLYSGTLDTSTGGCMVKECGLTKPSWSCLTCPHTLYHFES